MRSAGRINRPLSGKNRSGSSATAPALLPDVCLGFKALAAAVRASPLAGRLSLPFSHGSAGDGSTKEPNELPIRFPMRFSGKQLTSFFDLSA